MGVQGENGQRENGQRENGQRENDQRENDQRENDQRENDQRESQGLNTSQSVNIPVQTAVKSRGRAPWRAAFQTLSGAAAIAALVAAGYVAGAYSRLSAHHQAPRGMAAVASHLHGDLGRMIALGLGSSDDQLGMEGEPFPDTLTSYWQVMNTVAGHFYNPTPLSLFTPTGRQILSTPDRLRKMLTYSGIQGVMSSLDDPYSRFLDPTSFKEMQQDNSGSFAGIGAQLIDQDGKIVILKPLPDTPAMRAHIMPMDQIVGINGRSTEKMTSEMAVQLIRGKAGTPVDLTLKRGSKLIHVRIIRAVVTSQHFESRMLDRNLGYMHLLMFDEQAADNIEHALQSFRKKGARGVVFDLRDDPGGLLDAAVSVASKFIPPGPVVWVQERGGQRIALPTTSDAHAGHHLPLVVLVNHYSASASEIVSGAIKDTHSGTLLGITTWGKGLVQEVIPLNDGSAIALTTERYYTPNGTDINKKGVVPDVVLGRDIEEPDSITEAGLKKLVSERDAVDKSQLNAAVALLDHQLGLPVTVASSSLPGKPAAPTAPQAHSAPPAHSAPASGARNGTAAPSHRGH